MRKKWLVVLLLVSILTMQTTLFTYTREVDAQPVMDKFEQNKEYIVKWRYSPIQPYDDVFIIEHDPVLKVSLVKIQEDRYFHVLQQLMLDPNVEYIEPNTPVSLQTSSTTSKPDQAYYLDLTGLRTAKSLVEINPNLTIAILDTGIDFTHPILLGKDVPGTNLLDSTKPPADDHGHGTMVAGIIASILGDVKLMSVKVMGADGRGDALKVSQGIRYAVDYGADIISISLADIKYSKKMLEEVSYAESKGVLVVGVTGNNGPSVGYPAAFPTVLAVGAVNEDGTPASYSNKGPEVDVVAPGTRIYTTQMGGGYTTSTGTSMAGPQVVALAAMVWSKYPDLTPAQVRDLIRYSAKDVGVKGWNEQTGYGLIDGVLALMLPLPTDIHEPNNSYDFAVALPLGKQVNGVLEDNTDQDWFRVSVPYDGTLKLNWTRSDNNPTTSIKVTVYDRQRVEIKSYSSRLAGNMQVNVKKGTYTIKVEGIGTTNKLSYSMTSSFTIYTDAYGNNHSSSTAYPVPLYQTRLVGTLNTDYEEDWFEFNLPLEGTFSYVVSSSTYALDPVVTVIRPNGQRNTYDRTGYTTGNVEQGEIKVSEGKLKIGIRNYFEQATNGEYIFEWKYEPIVIDANEPNNSMYAATLLSLNQVAYGYIGSVVDYDYFKINVTKEALYEFQGENFPKGVQPSLHIYNSKFQRIVQISTGTSATGFAHQVWLTPGTYYVRIDAKKSFTNQLYAIHYKTIDVAFRDIANNWAQASINKLAGAGVISGYEDGTFRPNDKITRAEFVHLLVKALGLKSTSTASLPFSDVKQNYWARESILVAYRNGLITGYEDRTFRPNDPITRMEMVSILVRGLKLQPVEGSEKLTSSVSAVLQKFKDVKRQDWYAADLSILVQLNFIKGFEDGTFRPTENTSRAEVATMLERIWYSN